MEMQGKTQKPSQETGLSVKSNPNAGVCVCVSASWQKTPLSLRQQGQNLDLCANFESVY